jgi:NAD+ synthase (glutamine-hydrolysing)
LKGLPIGLTICEDIWYQEAVQKSVIAGAQMIISINASPFDIHKLKERETILKKRVSEANCPIFYAHSVGGQDEIVFDGRSIVINEKQEICHFGPVFKEALMAVDVNLTDKKPQVIPKNTIEKISMEEKTYAALETGLRDYVEKNNFSGVLVGVSGGIDSALTLAIAVDALGPERVKAVSMPSRYTSEMSIEDAEFLADYLGVELHTISIEPIFKQYLETLSPIFKDMPEDATEENIQARIRGNLLMALSNKLGLMVLSCGNKSELAVGYTTLYGDMVGGFSVLKDVYKTLVYQLARYRNSLGYVIPERIIERAPTAELNFNQTDQDTLAPYEELDQILERYVENDASAAELQAAGYPGASVLKIINLIERNEYKRRQAPPGVKITTRAFGRDRRYPITNGYKSG